MEQEEVTELYQEPDAGLEEVLGKGYDPFKVINALEEPDDNRLLCWCGEALTYVPHKGAYLCEDGHVSGNHNEEETI